LWGKLPRGARALAARSLPSAGGTERPPRSAEHGAWRGELVAQPRVGGDGVLFVPRVACGGLDVYGALDMCHPCLKELRERCVAISASLMGGGSASLVGCTVARLVVVGRVGNHATH